MLVNLAQPLPRLSWAGFLFPVTLNACANAIIFLGGRDDYFDSCRNRAYTNRIGDAKIPLTFGPPQRQRPADHRPRKVHCRFQVN